MFGNDGRNSSSFYSLGDAASGGEGSLTADELRRLDEVRRSIHLEQEGLPPELPPKSNRILSGITADYRDNPQLR